MESDQNVRRFYVTVDDSLLVGMLNRLANLSEEFQPLFSGKVVLVAVVGNASALDQFHDEVRPAAVSSASIEHLGNVGMVHEREGLPLRFEPGNDTFGVHAKLDDLERHAAANRFLLLGHIDHTAPAFTDSLKQFVTADFVAGLFGHRNHAGS